MSGSAERCAECGAQWDAGTPHLRPWPGKGRVLWLLCRQSVWGVAAVVAAAFLFSVLAGGQTETIGAFVFTVAVVWLVLSVFMAPWVVAGQIAWRHAPGRSRQRVIGVLGLIGAAASAGVCMVAAVVAVLVLITIGWIN